MKSNPPPWLLKALKITEKDLKDRTSGLEIVFDSEFAPSHSIVNVQGGKKLNLRPGQRPVVYNHHVLENLQGAIDICGKMGLPWLPCGLPIAFEEIPEPAFGQIMSLAGKLAEGLNEGGPEWLAIVCYMNWVLACHHSTIGSPPDHLAHHVFLAGATARELELALLNREHAERGRKTLRSASEGGRGKARDSAARTQEILKTMDQHVSGGRNVSEAARFAFKAGLGRSTEANRRLWSRHRGK